MNAAASPRRPLQIDLEEAIAATQAGSSRTAARPSRPDAPMIDRAAFDPAVLLGRGAPPLSVGREKSGAQKLSASGTPPLSAGREKSGAQKLSASGAPTLSARLAAAEARRKRARITIERAAVTAGYSTSWYRRVVSGETQASARAVAAIEDALRRLARGEKTSEARVTRLIETTFGAFLSAVCELTGLAADAARAADPKAGRNQGEGGAAHARARMLALYLTNTAVDVPQRRLAGVIGISPAAVCLALRTIEDLRDEDAAFTALLEAALHKVTGRRE